MPPERLEQRITELEQRLAKITEGQSKFVNLTGKAIYATAGRVGTDGSAVILPKGWTSAKDSTGNYTVTHNLGHTNYTLVLSMYNASGSGMKIAVTALTATSFSVQTKSVLNALADVEFFFFLIPTYET